MPQGGSTTIATTTATTIATITATAIGGLPSPNLTLEPNGKDTTKSASPKLPASRALKKATTSTASTTSTTLVNLVPAIMPYKGPATQSRSPKKVTKNITTDIVPAIIPYTGPATQSRGPINNTTTNANTTINIPNNIIKDKHSSKQSIYFLTYNHLNKKASFYSAFIIATNYNIRRFH
jgi:hypothetical protein